MLCSDKTGTLTSGEMTVTRAVGPFGQDSLLAGFISFSDPPLPDAADMLAALRRDGVTLKVLICC